METDSFTPSYLTEFTDFIIKRSIEDTHFNFLIFPLFMKYLLPFKTPQLCIEKLDIEVESKSDYKDYVVYFKSLFDYYILLSQKHALQHDTLQFFDNLISNPGDAHSTEATVSRDPSQQDSTGFKKRQQNIDHIRQNYKQISLLDSQIKDAAKRFNTVLTWECNDLHLIITTESEPTQLITKCIENMNKSPFSIKIDTLFDDGPEIVFQKFVKVICKNFTTTASFNDAKFWVLSQLFTRL